MLKPGDRIAVVAPAGIPDRGLLDQGMSLLRQWGYEVFPGRHLYAAHRYNAGTVEQRVEDLNWALSSDDIAAVWLARGGYGCIHCLPYLPVNLPKARVVIGNSDATSLLASLYRRSHTRLIHGPMLESLASRVDDETRDCVQRLLLTDDAPVLSASAPDTSRYRVQGKLIGGNLTVLASIAGTPYALDGAKGIVMLEDVSELAFRLDRCTMQLIESGALAGAQAVVCGEFTRCILPPDATFTVEDVVGDALRPLGIPVFTGAQFGHGTRNLPWVYGREAFIADGVLRYGGVVYGSALR